MWFAQVGFGPDQEQVLFYRGSQKTIATHDNHKLITQIQEHQLPAMGIKKKEELFW